MRVLRTFGQRAVRFLRLGIPPMCARPLTEPCEAELLTARFLSGEGAQNSVI